MNEYRISYQTPDGTTDSMRLIERSEQAARVSARRLLKEMYEGARQSKDTLSDVELVRKDIPATKQQERDTLSAIKKMVEELGPQSYISTAFEGCFADAESNIENDFGDSMKSRYERVSEELRLTKEVITAQDKTIESFIAWNDSLNAAFEEACEHETAMGKAAVRIVELAGQPESEEFQQAVKEHRNAKSALEYCEALRARLSKSMVAGA